MFHPPLWQNHSYIITYQLSTSTTGSTDSRSLKESAPHIEVHVVMGEEHQEFLVASAVSLARDFCDFWCFQVCSLIKTNVFFFGDLWMTSLVGWCWVGWCLMPWCDSYDFLMTNSNKNNWTTPWTQMMSPVISVSFQVVLWHFQVLKMMLTTNGEGGTNSLHLHGKFGIMPSI